MKNDQFAIGYLECMQCGKPALWILDDITYMPDEDDKVTLKVKYRLVNLKEKNYDTSDDFLICDSCKSRVDDSNYDAKYIIFFDELDSQKQ